MTYRKSIYVQSQFISYHKWAKAPKIVAFLRNWHRHVFKVRIDLGVEHNERELEFFMVLADLDAVLKPWQHTQVSWSCEKFCEKIAVHLRPKYPTLFMVGVSEDGENGAVLHLN